MGNCIEGFIFKLYPSSPKQVETEEGSWLRKTLGIATFVHFGLLVMCLAAVGFWPMLINMFQCMSAYSCYLTLREKQAWIYMFMIFIQTLYLVLHLLGIGEPEDAKPEAAFQMLGYLICLTFCCINGYLVGRAVYFFRKTGGLHGTLETGATPLLLEDKTGGEYARAGAEVVGEVIND